MFERPTGFDIERYIEARPIPFPASRSLDIVLGQGTRNRGTGRGSRGRGFEKREADRAARRGVIMKVYELRCGASMY